MNLKYGENMTEYDPEEVYREEGEPLSEEEQHIEDIKLGLRPGVIAVYHSIRDSSPGEYVKIEGEPWQLGSGEWVVRFDGRSGGFALANISKVLPQNMVPIFKTPACPVCGEDDEIRITHYPRLSVRRCKKCGSVEKEYRHNAHKRYK